EVCGHHAKEWTQPISTGVAWHRKQAREAGFAAEAAFVENPSKVRNAFTALWHLNRLIALEPTNPVFAAVRGRSCSTLGRWEEAARDYSRAIEGKIEGLWNLRGWALAEQNRWAEAAADFQKALHSDGATMGNLVYLGSPGLVHLRRGELADFQAWSE